MKKTVATIGSLFALWGALSISPSVAQNPQFPQTLPPNTVVGRSGIGPGPAQALPISQFIGLMGGVPNSNLSNMPTGTVKCNPTGLTAAPQDCAIASLFGFCIVDGNTFAASIAGIQAAINTASCKDIYIPAGTYSGTTALTIARSNVRLHGANGIQQSGGSISGGLGSTILSFSCIANAVVVGDGSAAQTWGGINIDDLVVQLPTACNGVGVDIKPSAASLMNAIHRVKVTETTGNTVGSGIHLESGVFGWSFWEVVVDHFSNGYLMDGTNHFTNIIGGQARNNNIGINVNNNTNTQNVVVANCDIEGNITYGIDIFSAQGFSIRDNFFDNGSGANARAIRIGAGSGLVEGVAIIGNLFNNGGTANYAIELASSGFTGLTISSNHFNSYATGNVLNNAGANGSHGVYFSNDNFFVGTAELSASSGFDVIHWQIGNNVGSLSARLVRPGVRGTAVVAGSFALSAGWGSTATATVTAGSRDTAGEVQINSSGAGIAAGNSVILTFQDGTWTQAPFCSVTESARTAASAAVPITRGTGRTATTFSWFWEGTPVTANSVSFTWNCWASN